MQFVQTIFEILLMLFGFGMLIFVHELGHFLAAKWAGIRTEGFAIGMGPHVFSWRKGTGFCLGSSERQREKLVAEYIKEHPETFDGKSVAQLSNEQYSRASDAMNLGETEYSLRWLPIGGFVKMLGQDDSDPTATSNDPRSYNMRPIGKRMVVVSAGVIMNIIFAAILFLVAFMVGVQFPAPIIGDISETMPAGRAVAVNAAELGLTGSEAKLRAGDEITHINGEQIETFADVELASAFSKVDEVLEFRVQRDGVAEPLVFNITPTVNAATGLRSIGLMRGASTTLHSKPADQ
ncbi:MAG: site-2 protease family protein, partial [Phycisphaerales bacterium]|nr:site-2 protease family protein [Phycisphaerales bacterium]